MFIFTLLFLIFFQYFLYYIFHFHYSLSFIFNIQCFLAVFFTFLISISWKKQDMKDLTTSSQHIRIKALMLNVYLHIVKEKVKTFQFLSEGRMVNNSKTCIDKNCIYKIAFCVNGLTMTVLR